MARKMIEWGKDNWDGDPVNVYLEDDGTYTFWHRGDGERRNLTKEVALRLYRAKVNGPHYNSRAANAKFKVGDRVIGKRGTPDSVAQVIRLDPYRMMRVKFEYDGSLFTVDQDDFVLYNSRAANAKFKVGDVVAYHGGPWKVVALHSLGMGGWSKDTYDLKSVETGVIVRDVPDFNIDPKNTLPTSNSVRACNSTNPIVRKAMNAVANTRTLPASRLKWTRCEKQGIEVMKKHLEKSGGVLPKMSDEISRILGVVPDIDTTEKQNVMSYFKYGDGKKFVRNAVARNADEYVIRKAFTPGKWFLERKTKSLGDTGSRKIFSSEDEARAYAKSNGLLVVNSVARNAGLDTTQKKCSIRS